MKLTAQAARGLKHGDKPLMCHVVRGLQLHAKKTGKVWLFYYRSAAGERRRPKVGDFPTFSLEDARKLAGEWYEIVKRGGDPSRDRQEYRDGLTVAALCDEYIERDAKRRDKPRTLEEKQRRIKLYIKPLLGKLKVSDVKLEDINTALDKVATVRVVERLSKRGKVFKTELGGLTAARHVRYDLSDMFRFAEHDDNKWRPRHSNPVRDAQRFRKPKRRRHMEGDEAPKVAAELDKLAKEYPQRVAALWVILLAGTRVTEILTAKRSQLSGDKIILTEHKTQRTGDERVIVLPGQALTILNGLVDDGSGYLFGAELSNVEARADGKPNDRARQLVRVVWEKAREAAGCSDLRVQDFRRTFASAAKSAGRSKETVGELLGHRDSSSIEAYTWLFDEAASTAAQDTADELEKRMRGNGN